MTERFSRSQRRRYRDALRTLGFGDRVDDYERALRLALADALGEQAFGNPRAGESVELYRRLLHAHIAAIGGRPREAVE